jgi:hypothetical protein
MKAWKQIVVVSVLFAVASSQVAAQPAAGDANEESLGQETWQGVVAVVLEAVAVIENWLVVDDAPPSAEGLSVGEPSLDGYPDADPIG